MRILHTSDWHLGRKLGQHDVHDFQAAALDHLVDTAIDQEVSAVLVSGDVFDGPVPPVDSLRLLNRIITRLHEAGITSILTAGNHDQADRLAANANLLQDTVHIVGSSDALTRPIELTDEHGPVLVYPLTFLWPDNERHRLADPGGEPLERSHEAVTRMALARVRADLAEREGRHGSPIRTVVMSHAFVTRSGAGPTDAERAEVMCESERDLSIGGVQTIPSGLFEGFTYVALGHLHRPQQVTMPGDTSTVIRYSGSLLRYTLSEVKHDKSFAIVTLGPHGQAAEHTLHPIPQGREMARLQGTLDELLSDDHAADFDKFVELVTTDRDRPDQVYTRLKSKYEAIVSHRHVPAGMRDSNGGDGDTAPAPAATDADILTGFLTKVTRGIEVSAAEVAVLTEVLEELRLKEAVSE